MRHCCPDRDNPKGWLFGPWNSNIPIPVGYANECIREKHVHNLMFEIYLVARGLSIEEVSGERVTLRAGDMLVVEPGEVHTFIESSADYLHFVIQTPFVRDDKIVVQAP